MMNVRNYLLLLCLSILSTLTGAKAQIKDTLTFAFTGDIMMGLNYPESAPMLPQEDGKLLFSDVASILRRADMAFGNLEGVLLDKGGSPKHCSNPSICYTFRMPERYAAHLVDAGYDVMSVANNHTNDFGEAGYISTMRILKAHNIAFAGIKERCEKTIIEKNGIKYGYCAFGHNTITVSIHNLARAKEIVSSLKKECDFVIVSFHGGAEGATKNRVLFKQETFIGENRGDVHAFAHACIDAGADIVYGHGPHVVRAIELYKDHLIAYSLGNFCTPYKVNVRGNGGYAPVLEAKIDKNGRFLTGKIYSALQERGQGPRLDKKGIVIDEIRTLTRLDFPQTALSITNDGTIVKTQ
ncbi:Capsule biosynthesis protein CapA [termite gut metagenome]|uniref:Capsule biosynthesis protein CapA n=1 Tax=termite gut metagenome TaxID=433724 RepID=A0A5J4RKP3_9ZZZZ